MEFFSPVQVTGGRKFQGQAYYLSILDGQFGLTVCLWDPISHTKVYASERFVQAPSEPPAQEEVEYDKLGYFRYQIDGLLSWCKERKPKEPEDRLRAWARTILVKRHPEIPAEVLQGFFPDHKEPDLKDRILSTLLWAATLKTESGVFHGRWCAGGKDLPRDRKIAIAKKALANKGLSAESTPGWEGAWEEALREAAL